MDEHVNDTDRLMILRFLRKRMPQVVKAGYIPNSALIDWYELAVKRAVIMDFVMEHMPKVLDAQLMYLCEEQLNEWHFEAWAIAEGKKLNKEVN